ncbi:hypothetical protein NWT09_05255 [Mycolicibacterium sp. jd]|uniref:hypothetical protein n=1 Tax=unclassified Mycolicibacterium TaxID=2636767 RepID=UPI00351B9E55
MLYGAGAAEQLRASHDDLAKFFINLATVVAEEARRNVNFRSRLTEVLAGVSQSEFPAVDGVAATADRPLSGGTSKPPPKRGRRSPGPWDPYTVYAEVGESGLRERLAALELEQLRDIISEHGMNHDGKAMRWKTADRVVGRIVERVVDRSGKGDAFRSA